MLSHFSNSAPVLRSLDLVPPRLPLLQNWIDEHQYFATLPVVGALTFC